MPGQGMDKVKLARAARDLVIDAPEEELRKDLAGNRESLSELAAYARGVVERGLRSAATKSAAESDLHRGFGALIQMLRRREQLSPVELAREAMVDLAEIQALESDPAVAPQPRTVYQLATYFKVPAKCFLVLSGAVRQVDEELREEAVRFAASSKGLSKLSREEKKLLNDFVRFLRERTDR